MPDGGVRPSLAEALDGLVAREHERKVAYGQRLYASGKADGAREEREKIIRWLNSRSAGMLRWAAEEIATMEHEKLALFEAGEHRK